jgi:hypothetical protein
MNLPSSHRDRVLAAVRATPAITRPRARRIAIVCVVVSIALALGVFESIGGIDHAKGRPLGVTIAIAGGWAVISAALTWLVVRRGGSTLARRPPLLLAAAIAAPFAMFAWMHVFAGSYEQPFSRIGWRCLGYTLVMAATPLASFLALRRGVEPRRPSALGAAAGAMCAAWAGVLVDLWCPLTNAAHVLVGHIAPLVAAIAVGAVLGRWALGVRTKD